MMRDEIGFTVLELAIVVVLVAVLASVALPKFYRLVVTSEIAGVEGVIGTVRSALSMQMARSLTSGDDIRQLACGGRLALYPLRDLLDKKPKGYVGVVADSSRRGSWYDDKNSHELVYVLRNDKIVVGIKGKPKKLRWRIEAAFEKVSPFNDKKVTVLELRRVTAFTWAE